MLKLRCKTQKSALVFAGNGERPVFQHRAFKPIRPPKEDLT